MTDGPIVGLLGIVLAAAFMLPFLRAHRRREARAEAADLEALRYGLREPVTMHPVVDPARCIGSGGCVEACPENVLGIRDGQAYAIAPARCIGHGLCERACPVEAITLVFGSEKRGVDIPRIRENFETNVPGLFVIGELGGMGLIRNAFEQGRQCIDGFAREPRNGHDNALDLLIVGCGPAGLSASLHAQSRGLRFETLEKEDIGGTVRHYPRKKLVMTAPLAIPGYGKLRLREIRKEELMALWGEVVERAGLSVRTGQTVASVRRREDDSFEVATSDSRYRAKRVVLAIGRRGVPRKLGVPGEATANVAYTLREPDAYAGDRIVVIGGGDAAVEAALALSEQPGTTVRLSYRGDRFSRIKPGNLEHIEAAAAAGRVEVLWSTELVEIAPDAVRYRDAAGAEHTIPNDRVFVFIGGELPTRFLRECGVEIETKFGRP